MRTLLIAGLALLLMSCAGGNDAGVNGNAGGVVVESIVTDAAGVQAAARPRSV